MGGRGALRSFLISVVGVLLAAIGTAALIKLVPLAQVAAGAAVFLIVVVFSAARAVAPRYFGVRHFYGLAVAALTVLAHWGALLGWRGSSDLAAFSLRNALAPLQSPEAWRPALEALAAETSLAAGGRQIGGDSLALAWMIEIGLILLFGLLGGHAARWRLRSRL